MSSDAASLASVIPPGTGDVLDLGGGHGELRASVENAGYRYINLDLEETPKVTLLGDAHYLPFHEEAFALVISKDSLEHFQDPQRAVHETHRVLQADGLFVIWVPFMHPFHGNDLYRYTPLMLRRLLSAFDIQLFESPTWLFTVIAGIVAELLSRVGLALLSPLLRRGGQVLDRITTNMHSGEAAFAAAYLIVARKAPVQDRESPIDSE